VVNLHGKFTAVYTRLLELPDYSFFLFGPRGTGKTTWLREKLPGAFWKNLLLDDVYLPLLGDRSSLRAEVEALAPGSWIVIDEVQRIPPLLNEVHDLIARHGERYKFAMSGSSARKLRRMDVNLLAGRAIERRMLPFSSAELGRDFDLSRALAHGSMPPVIQKREYAADILTAYVGTYLQQEIQQEALVDDVGSFHRFLKVAGIMNGELLNMSAVSRDAAVSRSTVERYFEILEDTLIGFRLPGWQPHLKVRERATPKFYLFDTGVARTLTGRIRDPLSDLEIGKLLETLILHELRAALSYQNCGGELYYWRSSGGAEVDFIWTRGDQSVALEVKATDKWQRNHGRALNALASAGRVRRCFGVYRGKQTLKRGDVLVLPCLEFLAKLHAGEVLG
jgi:uncharacterized protein